MSLFDGLLGNANEISHEEVNKELTSVLLSEESIDLAFKLVRDLIVFTEYRLILVDKQGLTGKKVSYKSIPYHSISRFSVETSGHFDLDAELKIWISSGVEPAETLQFKKDKNIDVIQKALALAVLKTKL
ncbi:PH domain-containing protein [Vagococcus sp.]|uniref:PH domain-containing protein n=1 Tax=Vagococcus sp. TaxID=1933889 RepID=UPI003F999570